MMNEKIKNVLKIILPMIFIAYFGSVTFFTHSHIVDGITIVHSHPYASDDNGNPTHEHTGVEIQLIHALSFFYSTASIILIFLFGIFTRKRASISIEMFLSNLSNSFERCFKLRPPPALI